MTQTAVVLSVLLLPCFFFSQTESSCKKNTPTAMAKLDLDSFLGKWYEYKTYNRIYNTNGFCASVEFTKNEDTGSIHVKSVERDWNEEVVDIAKLEKTNPSDMSGNFNITYFFKSWVSIIHKMKVSTETREYKVLGTDGKCWAVVYTCDESNVATFGRLTVLLRRRGYKCVTEDVRQNIKDVVVTVNAFNGPLNLDNGLLMGLSVQEKCWAKHEDEKKS